MPISEKNHGLYKKLKIGPFELNIPSDTGFSNLDYNITKSMAIRTQQSIANITCTCIAIYTCTTVHTYMQSLQCVFH